MVSTRTSAAVRSWFAGRMSKPAFSILTIASTMLQSPSSTSVAEFSSVRLSTPQPMVALPCGSKSTSSTLRLVAASEAARLTAVVVLPTPPFWFATAMIFLIGSPARERNDAALGVEARHGEVVQGRDPPARRQPVDLGGGVAALHREHPAIARAQMPGELDEVPQFAEC